MNRKFIFWAAVTMVSAALAREPVNKPNVILIFADDLGPGLLSCYGQEVIQTPYIDRLADEGISFLNYYGGFKQSPAGLVIKRDAGEISDEEYQQKFEAIKAKAHPIAENEVFLAEVAREAGYKTAQ